MKLRAPAVPLITVDPYFSVWSCADRLNAAATCHWTGHTNTINGFLTIDDTVYRFMGGEEAGGIPMRQISLEITAMATVYGFEADGVRLTARFFTPVFADDLDLLSRPVSYLELSAEVTDGRARRLTAELRASEELCLDTARQEPVEISAGRLEGGIAFSRMGGTTQPVLVGGGDDIRIDWGYFYLCVRGGETGSAKVLGESYLTARAPLEDGGALFAFAYDDVESIVYFGKRLKAYWKRDGKTIEQAIAEAYGDYPALREREERFSRDLCREAAAAGGEQYAEMLSLAYRQVMAGHKLVRDEEDGLLYISKECLSNGCAATVDVSYPSMPMYLYYNPALVNAMLRPVLRFSRSGDWLYGFAPHDVGCYPHLNGQVYSNGSDPDHQMPIEECGNMLVMAAAAAVAGKDASLFVENRDLFEQWAEYLIRYGEDPADQICTDDFFKHLPHNCNLAVKAIMGIASMAILLELSGCSGEAAPYWQSARRMARSWMERAADGNGGTRLAFDQPGTYSLKYNIVWDKLFGTGLFTTEELGREFASYWPYMNPYGLPLDCRGSTSKTDWLAWTGTLAESREEFARFMAPVWRYFHETENRVPMADWYSTKTAKRFYSQHRTVQGGLFIRLLEQAGRCRYDGGEGK
ncbi:MAG TPA: DUF4965 domain-containing protein [Firmicutes bacterium]|nr:DUF4965 domain-containing protein [Bacillota bacterium]